MAGGKKGKQKKKDGQQQPVKQGSKKAKEQAADPSGYAQAMEIPEIEDDMEELDIQDEQEEEEQVEPRESEREKKQTRDASAEKVVL